MSSKLATVVTTTLSTFCLMSIVVVIPIFWGRMQQTNTLMKSQLNKCHQDSNEIWRQLAQQGIRAKRQYNSAPPAAPSGQCCSCQQGPPGPPGSRGKDGGPGDAGMLGSNGRNGHPGRHVLAEKSTEPPCQKCPNAPPGPPGHPGLKGNRGNAGNPGINGTPGTPGRIGPPGPPGIRGAPGEFGMQGPPGDSGKVLNGAPPGPSGRSGPIGPRGKAGTAGRDGHPGVEGVEGSRGVQGDRGGKGTQGLNGPNGPPGLPGNKGSCTHCQNDNKPKTPKAVKTSPPAEQPTEVQASRQSNEETAYGVSTQTEVAAPVKPYSEPKSKNAYGGTEEQESAPKVHVQPSAAPYAVQRPTTQSAATPYQGEVKQQESAGYRAKAAPTRPAHAPINTAQTHHGGPIPRQQNNGHARAHGAAIFNGESFAVFEPTAPFVPKQALPAGYSPEQLASFSRPPQGQPTVVNTRQGYNVQLVGGYAANPVGRSWDQTPPGSKNQRYEQLSPPAAPFNYGN